MDFSLPDPNDHGRCMQLFTIWQWLGDVGVSSWTYSVRIVLEFVPIASYLNYVSSLNS
jgi:hypothetical protein